MYMPFLYLLNSYELFQNLVILVYVDFNELKSL